MQAGAQKQQTQIVEGSTLSANTTVIEL